jgi:hypothetical protein
MTTTASIHIATVRHFDPPTGVATVVVPALYGDRPVEARPFLSTPDELGNLPVLKPGNTVITFYDGGDPMTILRWYLSGGGVSAPAGVGEVYIGSEPPADPNAEMWFDTDAVAVDARVLSARPSIGPAATDDDSTRALLNRLRAVMIDMGMVDP